MREWARNREGEEEKEVVNMEKRRWRRSIMRRMKRKRRRSWEGARKKVEEENKEEREKMVKKQEFKDEFEKRANENVKEEEEEQHSWSAAIAYISSLSLIISLDISCISVSQWVRRFIHFVYSFSSYIVPSMRQLDFWHFVNLSINEKWLCNSIS